MRQLGFLCLTDFKLSPSGGLWVIHKGFVAVPRGNGSTQECLKAFEIYIVWIIWLDHCGLAHWFLQHLRQLWVATARIFWGLLPLLIDAIYFM